MFALKNKLIDAKLIRFLIAGAWNTGIGYIVGVLVYKTFEHILPVLIIGLISNVITITLAFLVYKLFVFKAKGNWWRQFYRNILLNLVNAAIGTILLYVILKNTPFNIYIAQALVVIINAFTSLVVHQVYTFK